MFTGIIDHCGKIIAIKQNEQASQIWIASQFNDLKLGESIAIDGVCLTVAEIKNNNFLVDISPETLRLTTLGNLKINSNVNLERAMQLNDRIGGHFVSGHVDQIAKLKNIKLYQDYIEMEFVNVLHEAGQYLIKKGSVAINGVSLTLNDVLADGSFKVMLIPHTLERTNLSLLKPEDMVNIEYDMLAKLVAKQLSVMEV